MEDYRTRIDNALASVKEIYPGVYNTAIEYKEARTVLLKILHREANVDKGAIMKYLNDNTDFKYEIRRKR